jgi:hypothetical protein
MHDTTSTTVVDQTAIDDFAARAASAGWDVKRSRVFKHGMDLLVLERPDRGIHIWFDHGWFDRAYIHDGLTHGPATTIRSVVDSWIAS